LAKLTCMRGYSGAGKSHLARELADGLGGVVVNRDSLRKMLFNSFWTGDPEDEARVTIAEEAQVRALVEAGISVVIDATHLAPQFLRKWAKLAGQSGVDFRVQDVRTDVELCLQRDEWRAQAGERSVGRDVILQQAKRFPMNKWPAVTAAEPMEIEPVEFIPGLPDACIFDIDGTLARMTGRSAFDYSRVHEDVVDESVAWINDVIADAGGARIFIVSGRDDECREETAKWLDDNGIIYHELLMRDTANDRERGNKIADTRVKYRLFNEHLRGKYNVRIVFDDRNSVVAMWRALGLKCAQVELGPF